MITMQAQFCTKKAMPKNMPRLSEVLDQEDKNSPPDHRLNIAGFHTTLIWSSNF